jgi:putative endonuclease
MNRKQQVGKQGEQVAVNWLLQNGYTVLYTNWRHKRLEVDAVASMGNKLVIVEVKTSTTQQFGHAEQKVTDKKLVQLKKAAEELQILHPEFTALEILVIAVEYQQENPTVTVFYDVY